MNYKIINVFLTKEDKKYYEDCLHDIKNGKEEDFINIYSETSEDFTFYLDLCSGTENYYLQYELVDKNNNVVETEVIDNLEDFSFNIETSKTVENGSMFIKTSKKYLVHFSTLENVWR